MADTIRVQVKGVRELQRILKRAGDQAAAVLARGMFRFAERQIANPAREEYAPVITGALKTSIFVRVPPQVTRNSVVITIGAGGAAAPYALSVHENPRSGKTRGIGPQGQKYKRWSRVGQWKYLETPALIAAGHGELLGDEVRTEVEALFRGAR